MNTVIQLKGDLGAWHINRGDAVGILGRGISSSKNRRNVASVGKARGAQGTGMNVTEGMRLAGGAKEEDKGMN